MKSFFARRSLIILRQNTLSDVVEQAQPGGDLVPDETLFLGRLEQAVLKTVRSCKRALRFQNRTRLQYENALRLKFDVLFLSAIDEAQDALSLETVCDQAEFL